ncbi:hypothetical protein OSW16_07190 [Pseudomonas putida]|uniref:capsular polysaccharide export protein, LipB/KpsS family n=1 Tax=Pseudomonas putida TaxID=303 RepID=UPI00226EB166|nr:hypothetical protein [Pseudomonas putida]WAB99428.1 hypothetical protein OSW16_07190 [Pseudomonas putida]
MKILLYIEPHPVRDSFEEFSGIGTYLAESLLKQIDSSSFDLRVFSNNAVIDLICSKVSQGSMICERPTGIESKEIENYKSAWGKDNINAWIELTKGIGEASELYLSILERIYKKYPFEAIVLWSENGAVRKFCTANDIIVLHGELGPTRGPFVETMYFDTAGTNGNAAVRQANIDNLPLKNYPVQTWLGPKSRFENNPDGIGIIDVPYTAVPDEISASTKFPYIYVPLQLADDLNTIKNSDFEGPLDFLEKVLPAFTEQGYHVIIKPHPGSLSRPYNLIEETKALIYARTFVENVTILDRAVTITRSLRLISQAAFVCTINSSVGYEALLLGKRALILGDAMYDINGRLKVSLADIRKLADIPDNTSHARRLFNFMSGHFLISKDAIGTGKPIIDILYFLKEMKQLQITPTQETYWEHWVKKFKYGINWLGENIHEEVSDLVPGEIFGNLQLLAASNKSITIKNGVATITAQEAGRPLIAGSAKVLEKLFIGNIDVISPNEEKKDTTKIEGWAIDDKLRQAALVLVFKDNLVLSHKHTVVPRLDTADYLRNLANSSIRTFPTNCGFRIELPGNLTSNSGYNIALLTSDNTMFVINGKLGSITK